MPANSTRRILFIDAYDSFSNNIISLLENDLGVSVSVVKIDALIDDFPSFLKPFSAVLAGPGPGHPKNNEDVGLINELWKLADEDLIPILGICLGFQSLVYAFGGQIKPLPEPRHGISTIIRSCGKSIFRTSETCNSVQYHSLCASLGHDTFHPVINGQINSDLWSPTTICPELVPLAWDLPCYDEEYAKESPSAILMGVAHVSKPLYGIQFHPESICSSTQARTIIANWWKEVMEWWSCKPLSAQPAGSIQIAKLDNAEPRTPQEDQSGKLIKHPEPRLTKNVEDTSSSDNSTFIPHNRASALPTPPLTPTSPPNISSTTIRVNQWSVASICERLSLTEREVVILDSEMHQRSEVGEYSIIGIVASDSLKLDYRIGTGHVLLRRGDDASTTDLGPHAGSVFGYLQSFMDENHVSGGHPSIPFWGGLMGYISYEACLETIDISPSVRSKYERESPDLSFVMIERSIVICHQDSTIHIQSIKPRDDGWVAEIAELLQLAFKPVPRPWAPSFTSSITYPNKEAYQALIRSCQDSIRQGDAYELCLTAKAHITIDPPQPSPWALYLRLRQLNPAPFGAFVHLSDLTLLSSSPERFLRWSRPQEASSDLGTKVINCQFRPIKGTVKKQRGEQGLPNVTLEEASKILATEKERAENLMIVDLIRHDLHGVVGSGRVYVPKLMVVEEYQTVYQLVTAVEGELWLRDKNSEQQPTRRCTNGARYEGNSLHSQEQDFDAALQKFRMMPGNSSEVRATPKSGIDVLASSLPPGSMTGAPKRRACRILQGLEGSKPRGVYSGIIGYLDAGGGGDFSVVIRSAVRRGRPAQEREVHHKSTDSGRANESGCTARGSGNESRAEVGSTHRGGREAEWTVGAGGAITSLSTEEGEWEEMMTKLRSTLRVFDGAAL